MVKLAQALGDRVGPPACWFEVGEFAGELKLWHVEGHDVSQ